MEKEYIRDNSKIYPNNISEAEILVVEKIKNKSIKELKELGIVCFSNADGVDENAVVISDCRAGYQTNNIMGYISDGENQLIIKSRFSSNEDDKDYFLQYMIQKVMPRPVILKRGVEADVEHQIVNFLMYLFPEYLRNALQKGLYKQYSRIEHNDMRLRGPLDVARHIKINTPFTGKIAYTQREHVYDNNLNELIRHTIECIKEKPNGNEILSMAKQDVRQIVEITSNYNLNDRRRIINLNKKDIISNAYYHEYADLQKLCIQILNNDNHQFGGGRFTTCGILFDGAWLWEEYLSTLLDQDFYHPNNKRKKGAHFLFSNRNIKIYPDFIGKDANNHIIADAKYKPLKNIGAKEESRTSRELKHNDYYQILSYMYRFDTKKGLFLYPEQGRSNIEDLWLNQGTVYESNQQPKADVGIRLLGFRVPQDYEGYEEFESKMKASENEFLKNIYSWITD